MRQMALRRPVSVSSISMGSSWLAKVKTRSVSGPKPALCICVRLRVSPSEKVMVSWSGVYLVQMRRICQRHGTLVGSDLQEVDSKLRYSVLCVYGAKSWKIKKYEADLEAIKAKVSVLWSSHSVQPQLNPSVESSHSSHHTASFRSEVPCGEDSSSNVIETNVRLQKQRWSHEKKGKLPVYFQ